MTAKTEIIAISGNWAIKADPLQWMLCRRNEKTFSGWQSISFVRSTREVLERCMQEAGCSASNIFVLVDGLPPTFTSWQSAKMMPSKAVLEVV